MCMYIHIDIYRLATGWTVRGSNPGWARFSAPVQTGPGAHLAYYTMSTRSFPGVKRQRNGVDPPSSVEVKKEQSSTSTPLLGPRGLL